MTTPHDPWKKADTGAAPEPSNPEAGSGAVAQPEAGQWYQDPRYADRASASQQPVAGYQPQPAAQQAQYPAYDQTAGYQYPAGDQTQWGGYGQQYPAGYPSYTGYSPYPSGFGTAEPTNKRPGVVVASSVLWIISGVLATIISIVIAIYGGSASDGDLIEDFDLSLEDFDQVDTIRAIVVTVGIVGAVFGAAMLVFGTLLLRRKGWARILTTVAGVVCVLPLIVTLVGPILVIVAIVLQFLPASNTWFRTSSGAP